MRGLGLLIIATIIDTAVIVNPETRQERNIIRHLWRTRSYCSVPSYVVGDERVYLGSRKTGR